MHTRYHYNNLVIKAAPIQRKSKKTAPSWTKFPVFCLLCYCGATFHIGALCCLFVHFFRPQTSRMCDGCKETGTDSFCLLCLPTNCRQRKRRSCLMAEHPFISITKEPFADRGPRPNHRPAMVGNKNNEVKHQ